MKLLIKDLDINKIDDFINPSSDIYGHSSAVKYPDPSDSLGVVDLTFTVRSVCINANHIVILFPNDSVCAIDCPSMYYHKIEVL